MLGEYNKNASNPMEKMVETLYDNAFTTHTYKHTTMGFLKDIENMPKEFAYSRQFFDRYYRPDNVDPPGRRRRRRRGRSSRWSRSATAAGRRAAAPGRPVEPPQKKEKRADADLEGRRRCRCCSRAITSPAFSTTNVDLPTLDVLAELLFAERAPLYKKLVIKEQKVESAVRARPTPTSTPTCSRCSRASRSPPTSATSRRPSTTRWPASPARASTTRRWPRCSRT